MTRRRPQCSDYATPTSSSSAGPSQKRSRSSATSIPSISSDEGSPETHAESDLDSDIWADVEAETAAAVMIASAIIDGLEVDNEANAEIQPKGTIENRVDVTTGIDIPNDLLMPDTIERLE
ncbi:hypothetical protein Tco_0055896 [Tanacetum coccineum]